MEFPQRNAFSNTGTFGPGNPFFRRGLSGMGSMGDITVNPDGSFDDSSLFMSDPTTVAATTPSATPWYANPTVLTALNSETLFGANLYRGLTNQQPLAPSMYAPQVAVGLSAGTQNLVMIGGIALLAVLMMGKRKKRK